MAGVVMIDGAHWAWRARVWLLAAGLGVVVPVGARAQSSNAAAAVGAHWADATDDALERINDNTVAIISGAADSSDLQTASDMAAVLNSDQIRIVPMVGRGGGQNVLDLLKLRGVDLAVTQTDILKHFRKNVPNGTSLTERLTYVTKLDNEDIHVVAGAAIAGIEALAGKTVGLGEAGSSEDISGRLIFDLLGIGIKPANASPRDALEMLKTGRIDASVIIAAKPSMLLHALATTSGFHLLPIAYSKPLEADYLPAQLSAADYPGLIRAGDTVDTLAVTSVLIAYDWPRDTDRYERVARFVSTFFGHFSAFRQPPRQPQWRDVNLAASLPGWRRFPAAGEWLERAAASQGKGGAQH